MANNTPPLKPLDDDAKRVARQFGTLMRARLLDLDTAVALMRKAGHVPAEEFFEEANRTGCVSVEKFIREFNRREE